MDGVERPKSGANKFNGNGGCEFDVFQEGPRLRRELADFGQTRICKIYSIQSHDS